jgi:NitT/TauT family transport system ATP-binding protein/nitrate/nitrite transport system substrate-binding protein
VTAKIRIGLLRLTDSAPVVVARTRGLFQALDIEPILSIEPSWANLADKLSFGLLDAAVMLAPLTLAMAAGLRGPAAKLIVPMGISQGGNTIVLGGEGARLDAAEPPGKRLLAWLRRQNARPRFAVVHRFSTHNLLLRYWLALSGIDPDRDIETVVVPPGEVVPALSSGQIAGFCAGAPWGVAAEHAGAGSVLMGTSDIWPFHPEKCLTVRAEWASDQPEALNQLLRALMRAQAVCDSPEEAAAVATALSEPEGLALPVDAVLASLLGGGGHEQIHFHGAGAGYPAPPHAIWFLRQMRRWGWLERGTDLAAIADAVYRPDLYARSARMEDLFRGVGDGGEARLPEAFRVPFDQNILGSGEEVGK